MVKRSCKRKIERFRQRFLVSIHTQQQLLGDGVYRIGACMNGSLEARLELGL